MELNASAVSGTVYITRHGEKESPNGCLSGPGWDRAGSLYDVFSKKYSLPKYIYANNYANGKDCERCQQTASLIANSCGPCSSRPDHNPSSTSTPNRSSHNHRHELIALHHRPPSNNHHHHHHHNPPPPPPLIFHLGLKVDMNHGYSINGGNENAAAAIKARLASSSTILVVWEHANIYWLAQNLGVSPKSMPTWGGDDYNTVYRLSFSNGNMVGFKISREY